MSDNAKRRTPNPERLSEHAARRTPHAARLPKNAARLSKRLLFWLATSAAVGILAGSAAAAFLAALDWATGTRVAHPWLVWLLPLAGLAVGLVYHRWGRSVEAGNNLIIDEIHDPRQRIPLRMTPLVLGGTIITHLCGGSAGREGTAVQMGASLADQLNRWLHLTHDDRRLLLMAGISGGFAAVFGTPLAGMVFGLEVLAIGVLRVEALFPCLVAALVGDRVTVAWGIVHTPYAVGALPPLGWTTLLWTLVAGLAFGLAALLFSRCTHGLGALSRRYLPFDPLRPLVGGLVVAAAAAAIGPRYLGLGIPLALESFEKQLFFSDFLWKIAFTAVTLGFGFKGGEVTPLFVIGATLGSALSALLPLPTAMLAGLGFVAVFAGAANTPLACTVMAMELFGASLGPFAAVACVAAFLCSGSRGIYRAQRGAGKL